MHQRMKRNVNHLKTSLTRLVLRPPFYALKIYLIVMFSRNLSSKTSSQRKMTMRMSFSSATPPKMTSLMPKNELHLIESLQKYWQILPIPGENRERPRHQSLTLLCPLSRKRSKNPRQKLVTESGRKKEECSSC